LSAANRLALRKQKALKDANRLRSLYDYRMASLSFDLTRAVNWLPDIVRSWLPWQWRPTVSNSLVWSGAFFVAGFLCFLLHFLLREKPKVDWYFLNGSPPLSISSQRVSADGPAAYFVDGVSLNGLNVSGHALQIFGKIRLNRDQRELSLFIIADRQWVATSEVESVPAQAIFNLGSQFRPDTVHWEGFEKPLSPEQFLRDVGDFTAVISIDGVEQTWTFSIDDLRESIERFQRAQDQSWLTNHRPTVKRKGG
jgi:hypothetical protein